MSHWLAEGGYRLAEHYGHPELFMGSKKQGFAAYDLRDAVERGLSYATSNRCSTSITSSVAGTTEASRPLTNCGSSA
jgi:aldehyde:ferredoxin oxidoreductase